MTLQYVKEPRTIILAVVPANADLSTSNAIKMTKEIATTGKSTLRILTKIHVMYKASNANKISNNYEINLSLRHFGFKLRS